MHQARVDKRLIAPRSSDAEVVADWSLSSEEAQRWWSTDDPGPAAVTIRRWWESDDVQPWVLVDAEATALAYGENWLDEDEDEVELAHLLVDPARRRAGIGRLLVAGLVTEARATGLRACLLRVRPENVAAQGLYLASGFEPVDAARSAEWNAPQPIAYVWMESPTSECTDS